MNRNLKKIVGVMAHGALILFVIRPLFAFALLTIAYLGFQLALAGGATKFIGLFLATIPFIVGLFFSVLALTNKLSHLSKFWKTMISYDLLFRGSPWFRLFWGTLFLLLDLMGLGFVFFVYFSG